MAVQSQPSILDKRLVQRYVSRGLVEQTEVQKALDALPDLAGRFDDISPIIYDEGTDAAESDAAEEAPAAEEAQA